MADLLLGVGADLANLRKDLRGAEGFFKDFRDEVSGLLSSKPILGNLTAEGRSAAASLLAGLRRQFESQTSGLRESLARNVIDAQKFAIQGTRAAEEFNLGLARGIDDLEGRNLLPPGLRAELVKEFRDIGESSADQLADAMRDRLRGVGDKIADVGSTLTRGLTVPLAAAAAGSIFAAETIDNAYDAIRIGSGKTGEALRLLRADFKAVDEVSVNSFTEVADAITVLSRRTGGAGPELRALSTDYLTLARLLDTQVKPLALETGQAFASFRIEVGKQGDALNFLFKTAQQTGIGVSDLSQDLIQFGPALRQLGFGFRESSVLIANFRREGVNVESAVGGMSKALVALSRKGLDAPRAFEALVTQIRSLKSESAAIDLTSRFFGTKGAANFAAAVREGRVSIDELLQSIASSPESIRQAAQDTDGFTEQLAALRKEAARAIEPLGVQLIGTLRDLQPTFISMIRTVGSVARAFSSLPQGVQNFIVGAGALTATIGPALLGVGGFVKLMASIPGVATLATRAVALFTGEAALAGLASLLLPGGIILVGLGLIAAAIYASGSAARQAERDIAQYKGALAGIGRDALPDLTKTVTGLDAQVKSLRAQRAEILKTEQEVTRFANRSDLGTGETEVKNPKIAKIDAQLAQLTPRLDAARGRFNQLLDAELATETGAHGITTAIKGVGTAITGLPTDIDFGTGKAKDEILELGRRVSGLIRAYQTLRTDAQLMPRLTTELVGAHTDVERKLANEAKLSLDQVAALREMRTDLRDISTVRRALAAKAGELEIPNLVPIVSEVKLAPAARIELPVTLKVDAAAMNDLRNALKRASAASTRVEVAELSGDPIAITTARRDQANATRDLTNAEQNFGRAMVAAGLSTDDATKLLAAMREEAKRLGIELGKTGKAAHTVLTGVAAVATIGRGLASILSQFRGIRQEIIGMISGLGDAADAANAFIKAKQAGDKLGQVGGVVGAIGAAVSIGASIADFLTADRRERERLQKETNEIIKSNNEALAAHSIRVEGFTGSVKDLNDIAKVLASPPRLVGGPGRTAVPRLDPLTSIPTGLGTDDNIRRIFDRQLRDLGTSLAELENFAKNAGITLYNSAGQIIPSAFEALRKELDLSIRELTTFQDTLGDQRSLQELDQAVNNVDVTPLLKLQNEMDLVSRLAPDLAKRFFSGIDTTTAAGQEEMRAALRSIVRALREGSITIDQFGELMGKDELTEIIRNADNALDELGHTANDVSGSLLNIPQGFKIAAARFDATAADVQKALVSQLTDLSIDPRPEPPEISRLADAIVALDQSTPDKVAAAVREPIRDLSAIFSGLQTETPARIASAVADPLAAVAGALRGLEQNTPAQIGAAIALPIDRLGELLATAGRDTPALVASSIATPLSALADTLGRTAPLALADAVRIGFTDSTQAIINAIAANARENPLDPGTTSTRIAAQSGGAYFDFRGSEFNFPQTDDPEAWYQAWRTKLEQKSRSSGADAQDLVLAVPR